ncbi:MAG: hypothetical protein Q7S08_03420 [bacterium]|nr:hypothetical protein [bacterium]
MEKILHKGKLVAIRIKSMPAGSVPMTPPEGAIQVLTLKHKKGASAEPHTHRAHKRVTHTLQECLVVISGLVRVSLYDGKGKAFRRFRVAAGETCVILSGIHGVEYLKNSEVIEIKNGPFIDDKKMLKT